MILIHSKQRTEDKVDGVARMQGDDRADYLSKDEQGAYPRAGRNRYGDDIQHPRYPQLWIGIRSSRSLRRVPVGGDNVLGVVHASKMLDSTGGPAISSNGFIAQRRP
jgi:hypothetical protein